MRRRLAHAAGRDLYFADMDEAPQERSRGQHDGACLQDIAGRHDHGGDAVAVKQEIVRFSFDDDKILGRANLGLHRLGIELAICLGTRTTHGRALAAVEHAELDATGIRHPPHETVEGVHLAHEMTLAQPTDRRIARHGTDGVEAMRHQRR
ncbi:hypothetical protein GGR16_001936 [Chelatococcus caeni]|uniref:Uncharacterized protein n=1 Tax=Chelatococcus caeni TaxID=1348468 RepID=A0A840C398_9HYPH|nr:hypothetical protein [Chelatococcus caeni]